MAEPLQPIKVSNFSTNEKIVEQIYTLTKPLYFDNTTLLEREINRCSDIYLVKNDVQLIAFFMVNFEKVDEMDTFYLGLSSCHPDFQGQGFAKLLYLTFFLDCVTLEERLNQKIMCWWTTATPVPYLWFNKNIDKVEPNLNGEISSEGHEVFLKIIGSKYSALNYDPQKPFILPGIAKNTKYSLIERDRLKIITNDLRLPAFTKHQIDETKGDRFLMIGYAPKKSILVEKLSKANSGNRTDIDIGFNMEMQKNEVKIRLANDDDFSPILNIWLDGIDNSFDKSKMADELYKSKFRDNFNKRNGIFNFWVAVDLDNMILGWQSLIKACNNPFRENYFAESSTYISKMARKKGIGELLLDFVIKEAENSTLTHIMGFVSSNNDSAKKITTVTGWIEIGIIPAGKKMEYITMIK